MVGKKEGDLGLSRNSLKLGEKGKRIWLWEEIKGLEKVGIHISVSYLEPQTFRVKV